jgi:hypothetical protein
MTITSAVIGSSESGFVISVIARSEATKQSPPLRAEPFCHCEPERHWRSGVAISFLLGYLPSISFMDSFLNFHFKTI